MTLEQDRAREAVIDVSGVALRGGGRLHSLDVFRGITIAAMLLVNNPGVWTAVHPLLRHANWHGWTPTDLIFPFFLFIVGVSMTFSFEKLFAEREVRADLFWAGTGCASATALRTFLGARKDAVEIQQAIPANQQGIKVLS